MVLFIGNLNRLTTERELKEFLSGHALIGRLKLMVDKITRRSRGYAYADIDDEQEARNIISRFNSTVFMESFLIIGVATSNQQHAIEW